MSNLGDRPSSSSTAVLLKRTYPVARWAVRRAGAGREEISDRVQETMVRIWMHKTKVRELDPAARADYLKKVAKNVVRDARRWRTRVRRDVRRDRSLEVVPADLLGSRSLAASPSRIEAAREECVRYLMNAPFGLTQAQAEAVTLFEADLPPGEITCRTGLETREIAEAMAIVSSKRGRKRGIKRP